MPVVVVGPALFGERVEFHLPDRASDGGTTLLIIFCFQVRNGLVPPSDKTRPIGSIKCLVSSQMENRKRGVRRPIFPGPGAPIHPYSSIRIALQLCPLGDREKSPCREHKRLPYRRGKLCPGFAPPA